MFPQLLSGNSFIGHVYHDKATGLVIIEVT